MKAWTLVIVSIWVIGCKQSGSQTPSVNSSAQRDQNGATPSPGGSSVLPGPSASPAPSTSPTPSLSPSPGVSPSPSPTPAPTTLKLEIVEGQGQCATENWPYGRPFAVQLTDEKKVSVSGKKIKFSILESEPSLRILETSDTTDSTGRAFFKARAAYVPPNQESAKISVKAEVEGDALTAPVYFTFRALPTDPRGTLTPTTTPLSPVDFEPIRVKSGQIATDAIIMQFAYAAGLGMGRGVPDLAFDVRTYVEGMGDNTAHIPVIECVPKYSVSSSNGVARCHLRAMGKPGLYPIMVESYGALKHTNFKVEILP